MKYAYIVAIGIVFAAISIFVFSMEVSAPEPVACTADAMQCYDGSYVGRSGPDCAFVCPTIDKEETEKIPDDVQATIDAYANLVVIDSPEPLERISSPLTISGKARGTWFFEAPFTEVLTDWDGRIIAEGPAQALGEWMTRDFVPFTVTLSFE